MILWNVRDMTSTDSSKGDLVQQELEYSLGHDRDALSWALDGRAQVAAMLSIAAAMRANAIATMALADVTKLKGN